MTYMLQAVIMRSEALGRFVDAPWFPFVVDLPQQLALLPLHRYVKEASGVHGFEVDYEDLERPFESQASPGLLNLLRDLSRESMSAYMQVECLGGPCGRWCAVYRDGELIFDKNIEIECEETRFKSRLVDRKRRWWHLLPPAPVWVREENPDWVPNISDEMFQLFGVMTHDDTDAWDVLGVGRYRYTADWPGGPGGGAAAGEMDPVS